MARTGAGDPARVEAAPVDAASVDAAPVDAAHAAATGGSDADAGADAAGSLEERVAALMTGADRLTHDLWDGVLARTGSPAELVELIVAARAADGGKFLRPRLAAAAFLTYGGTDAALLRAVAGAVQLLHVGLCVHDDLIDGDRVRHGRPGVVATIEDGARADGLPDDVAHRRGVAGGVLAGDLAITTAVATLLRAPAPAGLRAHLAAVALDVLEQAVTGETLDVWSETVEPTDARPHAVAALKTASYSIVLPLTLGALGAGAGEEVRPALQAVGEPLGIAYQLRDDDLGLFGRTASTGKSAVSDLRDGKRTEHVRLAAERADADQRARLDELLGDPDLDEAGAQVLRAIIVDTGARAAVLEQVEELAARAVRAAHDGLPPALAAHLEALTRSLSTRQS